MEFVVVIPSRFQSQRLPGKPLLDIEGKSLIRRVYEKASQSQAKEVIVATDDSRIYDHVHSFGGAVCMTSEKHVSGTDRIHEVCDLRGYEADQIVVNVQGDEPLISPTVINQVAGNIEKHKVPVATLGEKLRHKVDVFNSNVVKVVRDETGKALYFSRAPIPWIRDVYDTESDAASELSRAGDKGVVLRHLGIYAYRCDLLANFVTWSESPLEALEKLEQLRILWKGYPIHIEISCESFPQGIDTPDDLERVRDYLRNQEHSDDR